MEIFQPNRFYKQKEVSAGLRCSKSTLYKRISNGLLPPPVSLGDRSSGWIGYECQVVINAIVAGKSKDEIKALVRSLIGERQESAVLHVIESKC